MPSPSLRIRMAEEVIYTTENRFELANRSEYFASLENWQSAEETLGLEPINNISSEVVGAFLAALETDDPADSILRSKPPVQPAEFCELWGYFGCKDELLEKYVMKLSVRQRVELCEQSAEKELDLTRLLILPGFFDDMTRLTIPLDRKCCTSLLVATTLLRALDNAKPDWSPVSLAGFALQSGIKQITGNEKWSKKRLTSEGFAVLTLQKFCLQLELWTADSMQLVLDHLPPKPPNDEPKPEGLEAFVVQAMTQHNMIIPDVIKQWPELNLVEIAPALFQANRLEEATSYPNPKLILETVSRDWSPQECCIAIEHDQGGLGRLLDTLDTPLGCSWLADIPVFCKARNVAQGLVQALLFRCLFLHVSEFDSTLPPELLGTLELDIVGSRSIFEATRYLEAGIDSPVFVKLPWKKHGTKNLTLRVVRALQKIEGGDESGMWQHVNLEVVPDDHLEAVPALRLAVYALRNSRKASIVVSHLSNRVMMLEDSLIKLDQTILKLEKQVYRSGVGMVP